MLERAALATDNLFASLVERHAGYRLLREAVGRLADPDRVLSLARSSPHAGDAVENVLRTNSFAGELDGAPHMVLFPLIAVRFLSFFLLFFFFFSFFFSRKRRVTWL